LRSAGLIAQPARLASAFERLARATDFLGSSLGAMVVRVAGVDAMGTPRRLAWHVTADDDSGPEIPCMAAILLARRLAAGLPVPTGAQTAAGLLDLGEFDSEFARWRMITETIDESLSCWPSSQCLR
jgi:hypothetical protein